MDAIDVELDHVFSTRIDLRISTPVLGIDYAGKKQYRIMLAVFFQHNFKTSGKDYNFKLKFNRPCDKFLFKSSFILGTDS